jgi:CheY-like chemotaxis protein
MDVALGEMDGWEATQLIKANPATSAIPIVALTAHALASDRDKSVEVGCSDFDTKPVDMQRLLGKIRACLPAGGGALNGIERSAAFTGLENMSARERKS